MYTERRCPECHRTFASSCYILLARIFREVGCSRIASFWWDQGTGVDPTRPIALTLTLTPTRTNGPETSQKRGCAAFAANDYSTHVCAILAGLLYVRSADQSLYPGFGWTGIPCVTYMLICIPYIPSGLQRDKVTTRNGDFTASATAWLGSDKLGVRFILQGVVRHGRRRHGLYSYCYCCKTHSRYRTRTRIWYAVDVD